MRERRLQRQIERAKGTQPWLSVVADAVEQEGEGALGTLVVARALASYGAQLHEEVTAEARRAEAEEKRQRRAEARRQARRSKRERADAALWFSISVFVGGWPLLVLPVVVWGLMAAASSSYESGSGFEWGLLWLAIIGQVCIVLIAAATEWVLVMIGLWPKFTGDTAGFVAGAGTFFGWLWHWGKAFDTGLDEIVDWHAATFDALVTTFIATASALVIAYLYGLLPDRTVSSR